MLSWIGIAGIMVGLPRIGSRLMMTAIVQYSNWSSVAVL